MRFARLRPVFQLFLRSLDLFVVFFSWFLRSTRVVHNLFYFFLSRVVRVKKEVSAGKSYQKERAIATNMACFAGSEGPPHNVLDREGRKDMRFENGLRVFVPNLGNAIW